MKPSRNLEVDLNAAVKTKFLYWLLEHWLISSGEAKGVKYNFNNRPYLLAIAQDNDNYRITQKSSQCGMSELETARMVFHLDTQRANALYVHPSQEAMRLFVNGRIKPALEDNPYLQKKIGNIFNTEQLKFRASDVRGRQTANIAYFSGARERRQMITKDVSHLYIDEYDEMDQQNIYTLEKRLDNAADPYKSFFSTPTIPGYGINHKFLQDSDQKFWLVKCRHCSTEQYLQWEENILNFYDAPVDDAVFRCKRCHNEITDEDRLNGRYVNFRTYGFLASGYHVSKLMDIRFKANFFLVNGLDPSKQEEFYKSDLGEPFEPSGNKVTSEDLDSSCYEGQFLGRSDTPTTCGVDVGDKLHYTISQHNAGISYKIAMGTCNWQELHSILATYNVMRMVIDVNPERTKAKEFAKHYPFRVFLADYNSKDHLYKHQAGSFERISVNRTEIMTMVIESVKAGTRKIPVATKHKYKEYYEHMKVPIRSLRKNKTTGEMEAYFPKTGKPDHYFHAECYDLLAGLLMSSQVTVHRRGIF